MKKTSKKKPLVCTIDRKTWARGTQVPNVKDGNALLNEDNTRCCLGFLGKQVGISDEDMLSRGMPTNLPMPLYDKYPKLCHDLWSDFAEINDDQKLTEEEREHKLRQMAKANGFRFRFVTKPSTGE